MPLLMRNEIERLQLNKSIQCTSNLKSQKHRFILIKSIKEILVNYGNTTSLHGFNYITSTNISRKERVFWLSIVVIAIGVSIALVLYSWYWNRQTPTVTVIESSHFPTWNIPFPAVTICNFNKISNTKAEALLKRIKRSSGLTDDDIEKLFRMTMAYGFSINETNINIKLYNKVLLENNLTLSEMMRSLTPDCMNMISRCFWKGTNTRCDSLFQRIYTVEGVCCAFNYFAGRRNTFPEKIAYQVPKRPYRVTGCGYPTGLTVVLNPLEYDYYGTYYSSYGFRLFLHDAYNIPDENAETKVITSMRETFVRINPESTYATNDIKRMEINERNCLFFNERKLDMMQRYSFINCMAECRIKLLYEKCGCIPANMPNNGSMPLCGIKEIYCFIDQQEIFSRALPEINSTLSTSQYMDTFPCNCMPDCETNHYVSEITMGLLNEKLSTGNILNSTNLNSTSSILLHVFFSDLMSTRFRMEIFQNWLSALASFGGLLGLIMGFSIVTAFEFIYFIIFRPVFNYWNTSI